MNTYSFQLQGRGVDEWNEVAQVLIEHVRVPMLITLSGPLGAGKTTFVQALAQALGVEDRPRSPTFSLLRAYVLPKERQGIRRLVHIDAYRLEQASDVYALDLEGELAEPGTLIAIEWPEQLGEALLKFGVPMVHIEIQPKEDGTRTVALHA
jgi:tRNA threonylcarbamoyladenosine biosynthesis protein TsaE